MKLAICFWMVMLSFPAGAQVASSVRMSAAGATLYATVDGAEKKIATGARKAWLIDGGRQVVYSADDGAGGYENEGQGLHVFELAKHEQRKVMAAYFMIKKVEEMKAASGATALLVTMEDGGLGATHVAVVDVKRGEVFSADGARFLERKGNAITVASYRDEDWERLRAGTSVRPVGMKSYDVDELLKRPVIENKAGGQGQLRTAFPQAGGR